MDKDDIYSVRRAMLEKHQRAQNRAQQHEEPEAGEDDEDEDDGGQRSASRHCMRTRMTVFVQNLRLEDLGTDYNTTFQEAAGVNRREKIEKELEEQQEQEMRKKMAADPSSGGQSIREKRKDGFLNKTIRSLSVAAYLRCLYGAIECAPTIPLKNKAIACIKAPAMFRGITQLCDSTNWDEQANIGAKYLRVMRHVIRLPVGQDKEDFDQLLHYELITIVIQKALYKIVDKMKKDIQLTRDDTVTIYEVSFALFTIIQQTNQFQFSELDLVRVHREKELRIKLEEESLLRLAK